MSLADARLEERDATSWGRFLPMTESGLISVHVGENSGVVFLPPRYAYSFERVRLTLCRTGDGEEHLSTRMLVSQPDTRAFRWILLSWVEAEL